MASNYGSSFVFNGVTYKCYVVDFPEISTGKINTTNHSSGGRAENIPDGVVTLGEFTLAIKEEASTLSTLNTAVINQTIATSSLENNVSTMSGSSWIMSAKPEAADAQSPDDTKITVVVSPTGTWTIT
jgi:hypothetical protein